jgi:hypothetical protein
VDFHGCSTVLLDAVPGRSRFIVFEIPSPFRKAAGPTSADEKTELP